MRSYLIDRFEKDSITFKEVNVPPETLSLADHVIATNASWIKSGVEILKFDLKLILILNVSRYTNRI